jgi:septal ring factor EnvC (AmiA/AmiB activator)
MFTLGLYAQAPQPPLFDQTDVQALIDFCMSPTGEKIMQPAEPGTDRAIFCAGLPFVALYAAADVRNTQALDQVIRNQIQIIADIVQIQADLGAIQTQLINNDARITTLEEAPISFQSQIDAINAKLLNVANALQ